MVVLAGMALTGLLFWHAVRNSDAYMGLLFESAANPRAVQVIEALQERARHLDTLRQLYQAMGKPGAEAFLPLATQAQPGQGGMQALLWLERLSAAGRVAWEADAQRERISAFDAQGHLVAAPVQPLHYPIRHLLALSGGTSVPLGFDPASIAPCQAFLQQAARTGMAAAAPETCLRHTAPAADLLLAVLLPAADAEPHSFLLGLYRLGEIIGDALDAPAHDRFIIDLQATGGSAGKQPAYRWPASLAVDLASMPWRVQQAFTLAGQPWLLEIAATPDWVATHQPRIDWRIIPVGLLITLLLALYLYIVLGRGARATAQVHLCDQRVQHLFEDVSSIAVQGYDEERRVLFWNSASERLYGYSRAEALGQRLESLIVPPAQRSEVVLDFRLRLLNHCSAPSRELELMRKDGTPVPVYSSEVLIITQQGSYELYRLDIDLSERHRAEVALAQRDALLRIAVASAARLLREADPGAAIEDCFARIGELLGVDRAYLFVNERCPLTDTLHTSQRYEWCAPGIAPQIGNPRLQKLPYEAGGFARWQQRLAAHLPIVGQIQDFPLSERALLEPQGVVSILVVPISVRGLFWGFVGFDDCHHARDWAPVERDVLQSIAGNIGEAIARQQADAALHDSEERFRRITDNMRDLICQSDAEGRFQYVSPSYRLVLGYRPGSLLGRSMFEGLHPDDQAQILAVYTGMYAGGESGQAEFRYRRADGEYVWLQANGTPLFDTEGRFTGAVISSRDITAQRQVEEQLRLAARVFESTREGVIVTDAETRILSVNRAFSDITGYSAAEAIGQTPRLLSSGRHDRTFFQQVWHAVVTQGHWQGELWNRRKNGEIYPEWLGISAVCDEQGNLSHYIGIFTDVSESKASADRIEFLAHHDPLTALPNRILLRDRLEQALVQAERQGSSVTLLALDLDRFSLINDSLGHEVGDQLLQMVALWLHARLREVDTLSRQGGDEFLVLLPDTDLAGGLQLASDLLACLNRQSCSIAGHTLNITASIGLSVYPALAEDSATLLTQAGTALQYVRNSGGNAFRGFSAAMNVNTVERLRLESDLRQGLERDEFMLYYQPQLDVASGRLIGAEALLRWQHPERGAMPPGLFIPIAEDSGLIVPLGEWVLREACRQTYAWQQAGLPQLNMAVNLSALQFNRSDLLDAVARALADSGLNPGCLELELTESILIQDADSAMKMVEQLRAMGLKLSIDDFGTGYSSLRYLQKLPVQKLKIDQSFVRALPEDGDSRAIVRAIVQLAHSLQLITVAEGVETAAQFEFLRGEGCDQVQGYYIDRPLPAAEFAALLARQQPGAQA